MRIGIDARLYGTLGKGLGRYVAELIAALEKIDDANEYVVFLREENFGEYVPQNPRFTKVLAEFPWYTLREQVLFALWLRKFRIDLMHFTHFNVPFLYRRPFVVTIHDLILLRFPTIRSTTLGPALFRIKYFFYRLSISRAIRDAQAVITVSEWSKQDIERHFPAAKGKTTVTLEAAAHSVAYADLATEKDAVALPPKPYALYVGNAYPHKNLDRLLEAFRKLRETHPDHRLVLVGGDDYFYRRLREEAAAAGTDEQVTFFGRATDAQLAKLYDGAALYVFPSLCEGFGLPPLEAMSRGLPVASSHATCLPEILGDAAHYFDPERSDDIARAMREVIDDPALRSTLIAKGREQVGRYSWESCARATLDVYQRALS